MQIVVIANGLLQNDFNDKGIAEGVQVHFKTEPKDLPPNADACFYLLEEEMIEQHYETLNAFQGVLFINAVITTLDSLPANAVRLNGWSGFFQAKSLELAAKDANKEAAKTILEALEWQYNFVPDVAGMITPRTIAMIVNEAYFALEEKVSTKEEIDIAMKLGTSYPYGPFEWSENIGLANIHQLLSTLTISDPRYAPAPLLTKESKQ